MFEDTRFGGLCESFPRDQIQRMLRSWHAADGRASAERTFGRRRGERRLAGLASGPVRLRDVRAGFGRSRRR